MSLAPSAPIGDGYRFFSTGALRTFLAIAECIVPSESGRAGASGSAALMLADAAIADRPVQDQKLIRLFLVLIEWLPFLRFGRRFSTLSRTKQRRVLEFFESNRFVPKFRAGFFGVKTFALLGFYGLGDTFAELEYPGPRLDAPYYKLSGRRP
jgi:hypothetical protein